jgi:phosphatidylinositol-bisphosphatase
MLLTTRDVAYEHIDFHQICNANSYESLNPYIHKLEDVIEAQSFFAENLLNRKPRLHQKGAFRINCVDCLDRTNAFMTKLLFIAAENMLGQMGQNIPAVY